jgi:hypothetical protein
MFFTKQPLLCYCTTTFLRIYDSDDTSYTIPFPRELLCYGEILELEKFEKLLLDFITGLKLQYTTCRVILSPELVFFERLDQKSGMHQSTIEKITAAVPLAKDAISILTAIDKNGCGVYITNKKVYTALITVLNKKKIAVTAVVPVIVFADFAKNSHLSISNLRRGMQNKKLVEQYDFLSKGSELHPNKVSEQSSKKKKQSYLLLLSILMLLSAITYLLFVM